MQEGQTLQPPWSIEGRREGQEPCRGSVITGSTIVSQSTVRLSLPAAISQTNRGSSQEKARGHENQPLS